MTLEELLTNLKGLTYRSKSLSGSYEEEYSVISSRHFDKVEMLIRQFAMDNHDAKFGELQGKIRAYELIIAKSNFAPILQESNYTNEICECKEELAVIIRTLKEYYERYDEEKKT